VVIDLPLNTGDGTGTNGLGFPTPNPADLLAFELNTEDDPAYRDGGCYTLIGVDFFESAYGDPTVKVQHATVYDDLSDIDCGEVTEACCFSDGECSDLAPTACSQQGGHSGGPDTNCATYSCTVACCLANGTCVDLDSDACEARENSQSGGYGTSCANYSCD